MIKKLLREGLLPEAPETPHSKKRLKDRVTKLSSDDISDEKKIEINNNLKKVINFNFNPKKDIAIKLGDLVINPNSEHHKKKYKGYYSVPNTQDDDVSVGDQVWALIRNNKIHTVMLRKSEESFKANMLANKSLDVNQVIFSMEGFLEIIEKSKNVKLTKKQKLKLKQLKSQRERVRQGKDPNKSEIIKVIDFEALLLKNPRDKEESNDDYNERIEQLQLDRASMNESIDEFDLNEETIEEGAVTNWIAAGALILGTLGPNTSLAQKYNDGDDKAKITILNKIKSSADSGSVKFKKLFDKIKNKVEGNKDNAEVDTEASSNSFSIESFKKLAKESNGFIGIGKSTNMSMSNQKAMFNAKAKMGEGTHRGIRVIDSKVTQNSEGKYTTYIILAKN